MARPSDNKGGRVTPKGNPPPSRRYTPPPVRERQMGENPRWVPVTMFGSMGVGAVMIVVNYLGVLPGGADNIYLLVGLALITVGFVAATQYH
ncbi:MAG TPA: cell division protein CrgA [Acidimicrobiales bacterium]|jgi:hypothetical protein